MNPMLAVETLFRWNSRETKDAILNNYDNLVDSWQTQKDLQREEDEAMARYMLDNKDADDFDV